MRTRALVVLGSVGAALALGCSNVGGAPISDANVALPTCTSINAFLNIPISSPPFIGGWSVQTRGVLSYDATMGGATTPTDVHATLTGVDTLASSITLTVPTGTIEVFVHPVTPAWLTALPIGHSVIAHFERGVVLRDATSDALLLAVVEGLGRIRSASFDVGPIHVDGGSPTCISLIDPGWDCVMGQVQTQVRFTLGTSSVMSGGVVRDGARAFDVRAVGSVRQAIGDEVLAVTSRIPCGVGLQTGTVVSVGMSSL